MSTTTRSPALRAARALAVFATIAWTVSASAAPTSVQVCTQVLDNADTNTTEGGNWSYSVATQAQELQTPTIPRNESQSGTTPPCASSSLLPGGTTGFNIRQLSTPPANWLRNAPGYPQWVATDGTKTVNGSGDVQIDATQFTGAVKVTFTNASGRIVYRVCHQLQDNAITPVQSGNFTLDVSGVTATLAATEGAAQVCTSSFQANLPVGATSVSIAETAPFVMAASFPTVTATGASGSTNATLTFLANTTYIYTGSLSLTGTAGDVSLAYVSRIDVPRSVQACKLQEASADGIDQSGLNRVMVDGNITSLTVTEGAATPVCSTAWSIAGSATTTAVREYALPGTFTGFALDYPKWTIARQSAPGTILKSGFGAAPDITWSDPALAGATDLQLTFTDKAGAFSTTTKSATTGTVTRVCKRVEDNANGIVEGGVFTVFGYFTIYHYGGGATPATNEGAMFCPGSVVRTPGLNTGTFLEVYQNPGWPGNVTGYPKLNTYNVETPAVATPPLTTAQMGYSASTAGAIYVTNATLPGSGDSTAVVINKTGANGGAGGTPTRTLTYCVRVDDNGLAPANDGGTWTFSAPTGGNVTAIENGGAVCLPPAPLPDPNTWQETSVTQYVNVPASWPGFDVYANALPFAASPYVSYTTTGGQSGTLDAGAAIGPYGTPIMSWTASQALFQSFTGNVTATFVVRPSARYQVCSRVLQNGDGTNDSNTFGLSYTQGGTPYSGSYSVTEGGAAQCLAAIRLPDAGALTTGETLAGTWDSSRNTPGFPQWSITSTGPTPVSVQGSGLTTGAVQQNPASQQGDTTVTFSNRLGADRYVKFCKRLVANADTNADSGTFTLSATGDDAIPATNLGSFPFTVTEGSAEVCSPQVKVPALATHVAAQETLPGGFVSGTGYPKWTLRRVDNTPVSTSTGTSTIVDLNTVNTTDFSVLCDNQLAYDADISVTKTDGSATYTAGLGLAYTIVVKNAGPSNATGVSILDHVPAAITNLTVNCVATGTAQCGTNLSGGNDARYTNMQINAGAANALTITVTGTVASSATGNLSNTVSATVPPGNPVDLNSANDNATDTDTPAPSSDLALTVTDGSATYLPNRPISYTVRITNAGPSNANGVALSDVVPAGIGGVTATCSAVGGACGTNASSGNNVSFTGASVAAGAGNSLTYTVQGTVARSTTGALSNTGTTTLGSDPIAANNSATDTDSLGAFVDLAVSKTDGRSIIKGGALDTYTITVTNLGNTTATGATVTDALPSNLLSATWTCTASGGAACTASGTGSINDTVTVPTIGQLVYHLTGTAQSQPEFPLSNTASASAPGAQDVDATNDSANDQTAIVLFADGFESAGSIAPVQASLRDQPVGALLVPNAVEPIAIAHTVAIVAGANDGTQAQLDVAGSRSEFASRLSYRDATGYWHVGAWQPTVDGVLVFGWTAAGEGDAATLSRAQSQDAAGPVQSIALPEANE